eukprot:m.195066 g.195066  ORF g.195066 m.195066 type:complete len:68 (+) comp16996_c0_seq37:373-576(+)
MEDFQLATLKLLSNVWPTEADHLQVSEVQDPLKHLLGLFTTGSAKVCFLLMVAKGYVSKRCCRSKFL